MTCKFNISNYNYKSIKSVIHCIYSKYPIYERQVFYMGSLWRRSDNGEAML